MSNDEPKPIGESEQTGSLPGPRTGADAPSAAGASPDLSAEAQSATAEAGQGKKQRQARREKHDVHGWVVLDKPVGMTSTHAVSVIKRLFKAKRAGHAGTLD